MSIRLNKALRELNIGLQTAVEFLSKRSDLGEVEAEPSFKLSDQQYKALTDAFSQDKKVRDQARSTWIASENLLLSLLLLRIVRRLERSLLPSALRLLLMLLRLK